MNRKLPQTPFASVGNALRGVPRFADRRRAAPHGTARSPFPTERSTDHVLGGVPGDAVDVAPPKGGTARRAFPIDTKPLLATAIICGLLLPASGCSSLVKRKSVLPARHTLVLDPLIVHSDFQLPPHHRLLNELVLERNELLSTLDLAKSEEPVQVYLFDTEERFRDFSGRYYPDFPQRRAFFVESDTRLAVYAYWGDRVAEDLRHEVAHGYLHSVVPNLPLWLDEGLAEYAEVPQGNGGLNQPHVQLLLEKLAQHSWRPNLARLERLASASEMTQSDYAEAWAWVHWLLQADPAGRKLLQTYLADLRQGMRVPPFSARLSALPQAGDAALIAHLQSFTAKGAR